MIQEAVLGKLIGLEEEILFDRRPRISFFAMQSAELCLPNRPPYTWAPGVISKEG